MTWYFVSMNRKLLLCACLRLTLPVVSGSLRMLIATRGRLPEDQSLHYQAQVLQALEYLEKKKVAHLDIKGKKNNKSGEKEKKKRNHAKRCSSHIDREPARK